MLGSFAILISPGLQNMITFAVSVIALVLTREYSIHYDSSTDLLAYVASIQIVLAVVSLICQVIRYTRVRRHCPTVPLAHCSIVPLSRCPTTLLIHYYHSPHRPHNPNTGYQRGHRQP